MARAILARCVVGPPNSDEVVVGRRYLLFDLVVLADNWVALVANQEALLGYFSLACFELEDAGIPAGWAMEISGGQVRSLTTAGGAWDGSVLESYFEHDPAVGASIAQEIAREWADRDL